MSYDSPAANGAFKTKFDFPYDLLSDEDGKVSVAYGVSEPDSPRSPRKSVLIGPDGKVAAAYNEVSPGDHPQAVLADLDGIGDPLKG